MATLETTTGFRPVAAGSSGSRSRRRDKYYLTPKARAHQAKWYSRFVQMMKFLLPAVAVLLIVLILVWPYLKTEDIRFRISFAAFTADQTEDPSMVNPRYLGIDKDNQSFSITADLARKLAKGSLSVELEMPKADITLEDGSWLVVTAENGVYQRTEQTLNLTGAVNLYHDSGYEFRTAEARVDLEKGTAAGATPIRGQGPFGDLQAEGFRLIDKGKTIIFTGKSKLVLYPGIGKPIK